GHSSHLQTILQRSNATAIGDVPQSCGSIIASRCQCRAVWREINAENEVSMPSEVVIQIAVRDTPEFQCRIAAARSQKVALPGKRQRINSSSMSAQGIKRQPISDPPDFYQAIGTTRGDQSAVRRESQGSDRLRSRCVGGNLARRLTVTRAPELDLASIISASEQLSIRGEGYLPAVGGRNIFEDRIRQTIGSPIYMDSFAPARGRE